MSRNTIIRKALTGVLVFWVAAGGACPPAFCQIATSVPGGAAVGKGTVGNATGVRMAMGKAAARKGGARRMQYPDLLSAKITIRDTADVAKSFFSDLGAWHAYGLPGAKVDYGSFTGPLIMDMDGRWLSNAIARLRVSESGKPIDLSGGKVSLHYYPGLLQASYEVDELDIRQRLIFVTAREARIETVIHNLAARARTIDLSFTGQTLLANALPVAGDNGVIIPLDGTSQADAKSFRIGYDHRPASITVNDHAYTTLFPGCALGSGGSISIVQSQYYFPEGKERGDGEKKLPGDQRSFADQLSVNEKRWDGYLSRVENPLRAKSGSLSRLAVKAVITLLTNWRSATKDLLHDGVFPSVSYQGFYGVWSWDSWKQAVALGYFIPHLARDNIRCLFDYQDSTGMVPDCIYTDKKENNLRDTKPPLAAWAVLKVYQSTGDRQFLREMYPRLVRYHHWWYVNRDNDGNGLCEYGSTDGTRIAAAWESGMDNAVRFDSARMVRNSYHAWSLNQESVDLNAYLYAEKIFLMRIAAVLGERAAGKRGDEGADRRNEVMARRSESGNWRKESAGWRKDAAVLKGRIEQRFYSRENGYYYDYHTGLRKLILIEGPEGWIPLWAGIPTNSRARQVMAVMENKAKFNTFLPLPTLSADHRDFNPENGYWRGPVWLDQFYFGVEGLRRYRYTGEADRLTRQLFQRAEGLLGTGEIRENYHPLTGKGLNAVNFSWSAAFILMLLMGPSTGHYIR